MKPVAWLVQYKDRHEFMWSKPEHLFEALACEPLYTHPAKTLTDEEIKQIFQEQTGFFFDDNPADDLALMDFAIAILRKAQEK